MRRQVRVEYTASESIRLAANWNCAGLAGEKRRWTGVVLDLVFQRPNFTWAEPNAQSYIEWFYLNRETDTNRANWQQVNNGYNHYGITA